MRLAWFLLPILVNGAFQHQVILQSHHELFPDEHQLLDISQTSSTATITIRARPTTVFRPRSLDALHQARQRSLRHEQSEAVEWDAVEVPGPDIEDKHTLIQLARMAGNAYSLGPGQRRWYDVDMAWNTSFPFGWDDKEGFRGHVFLSSDNSTVILAIKGTTIQGPTSKKDKFNDNLLFSCCCAFVDITWIFNTVCNCFSLGRKCDNQCLADSLKEDSLFYSVGVALVDDLRRLYPSANIWLVGHSLGGALASLLGSTYGLPAIAFESPGDRLAAQRLHLPLPPSANDVSAEDPAPPVAVTHVYHTADPIPQGACTGFGSLCAQVGYALETKCHLGKVIIYDTVNKLRWRADVRKHGINKVVLDVLERDDIVWEEGREVPLARAEVNCSPEKKKSQRRDLTKYESHEVNVSSEDDTEHQSQENDSDNDVVMSDGTGDIAQEEWGGIQDGRSSENAPDKSKKPPTGEEIRTIIDATELFRSNAFKLQIDALLPNVRPKASKQPPLDRFLLSLHTFLFELPPIPQQHPLEAARKLLKKGVAVPYSSPLPTEETNWKVAFEKPSDIMLVGSWANKVTVKAKDGKRFVVDVAVEMPDGLFQEKDYLNARFFQKRAFYLATIAAALQKSKFSVDVLYDSLADDPRMTSLVIVPQADENQFDFTKLNAQVNIIPIISKTCPIPLHRLSPSQSNIRIKSSDNENTLHSSTPIYNTRLLQCLTPKIHLLSAHSLKQDSPAFADALTLLRVWANQRGYGEGSRLCVHGFKGKGSWWGTLLDLLIRGEEPLPSRTKGTGRRPLGRGLSSYQMFRAALDVLAKFNAEKDAVFVRSSDGHRFPPEEYRVHHDAVFVDSASLINFLTDIPRGSLELLSHDARMTLETLDDPTFAGDPFNEAFLKERRDIQTRFDLVLRVDLSKAEPRKATTNTSLDHGSPYNALAFSLDRILHQALGNRSRAITIVHPSSMPRPLNQAHPFTPSIVYIGLLHDPEHAFRLVDHGPAADERDQNVITQFRDLWGDKAELRRFKDGRILESVVWDVKTADEKAHIPALIIQHVLGHHFGLTEDMIITWQSGYDSILRMPPAISSLYVNSGVPIGFKAAIDAFDGVVKSIKSLDDDLPLALVQVSPISENLRYTSVFGPVALPVSRPPLLPPNARYISIMEVILQFEKSARWPDDLKAIQKMKLAFFERMATRLMATVKGLKASVVIGDGVHDSEIIDKASLEIQTPQGWSFSARIWHDREATLLDRILDANSRKLPHITLKKDVDKNTKEYQEALEAKKTYMRRFIHAPKHHKAIITLSHHHSALSGTVRLVKRWFASHWLLQGHISEEAVEIICASLFTGSIADLHYDGKSGFRTQLPGSKERGFAAAIEFLKDWKWEDGLFVPLYAGDSQLEDFHSEKNKLVGGPGVWKISTEMDSEGKVWTSSGPDVVAANRVKALAKATWECLQQMERGKFEVKTLFLHPTDDYDFIIKLDKTVIPRYFQNIAADPTVLSRRGKFANLASHDTAEVVVRPGFDPVQLLFRDLQRIYADTFRLFHDVYGGDQFGGVWDRSLKQSRPFRVLGGFSSVPAPKVEKQKAKDVVVLNEAAILSEIERLGAGLIKEIIVHT